MKISIFLLFLAGSLTAVCNCAVHAAPHETVPPVSVSKDTYGYSTGYGTTKAGAQADARKGFPKGAQQSGSPKFVKEGSKWKCTMKWFKRD